MTYRLGLFLVLIGVILLIISISTALVKEWNFLSCLGAAFCLVVGVFLLVRYLPRSEPSGRFRLVNKIRNPTTKDKP
ncbi:MAG: hypothetical protein H6Q37_1560 [Chloroflexi bacterium]|nr:hypothetical protein [Chloroflexota bacterium]